MARIHFIYFDLNTGYYANFHHGLAYIIATLKNSAQQVFLTHIANEDTLEEVRSVFPQEKIDILALSFTTNQKKYVQRFLSVLELPRKLTIAGGVHCSLVQERVFQELPGIDGVCIGEGEIPLQELCRRLDAGKDYLSTPSFYFKRGERIIKNPVAPLPDIDTLPFPDYSLFDFRKIVGGNAQCFPMLLSRGCSYSCYYCCNHTLRELYPNSREYVRRHSVERAIEIIKANLSLHPQTGKITFSDDTFTLNRDWLLAFGKAYRQEIGLPFVCNARVETLDDGMVRCLKSSGCVSIDIGVETGNEWLRKYILNRRHSNLTIKEAFRLTEKHHIKSFAYTMVGFPFETREMAAETLALNIQLRPNFGKCFYYFPYPGTKLSELSNKYNLLADDLDAVSGYMEKPSIKQVFMSHWQMKKHFELLQVFFYARLLLTKARVPHRVEKALLKVVFLFRKPIMFLLNPTSGNSGIRRLRRALRNIALERMRWV